MILNEAITLVARETGWTLEYIGEQPVGRFYIIVNEIIYQKDCETYQQAYNSAMILCALINSKDRHYSAEEIIGERPERRDMEEQIGTEPQIETISTPAGKTYKLWPLTVNMMVKIQEKFGKTEVADMTNGTPNFEVIRMMYYLRASKCHPDVTIEDAGEMALNEMTKLGV